MIKSLEKNKREKKSLDQSQPISLQICSISQKSYTESEVNKDYEDENVLTGKSENEDEEFDKTDFCPKILSRQIANL